MEQKEKSFSETISNLNTTSWDAYSNYRLYSDSEFKQQSKMTYEELCSVLKTKYGAVTTRQKSEEKLLTHYIHEGYYAGFDNIEVDFEHSKLDFVYCNIFEHLLLHIIDAIRFFSTPTEQLERYLRLTSLHITQYNKKDIYQLTRIDSDEWKFAIYGSEIEFIGPEIKRQFIKNELDFNISEELFNQTMIDYLYTIKKKNKRVGLWFIDRYQQRVLEHCFVDETKFIKWLELELQYKGSFASVVMSYNIGDKFIHTFGPFNEWFDSDELDYLQEFGFLTEQDNKYMLNDCPVVALYKLKTKENDVPPDKPSTFKVFSVIVLLIIITALVLYLFSGSN